MQKSIYVMCVAFFALALSSCSRGYGCDYGATELKPIDKTENTVLLATENNETTIDLIESEVLAD